MFGRKAKPAPARPVIKDPFGVVPLVPANVDVKRDSRGMIHLRLNVPVRGFRERMGGWFGYDYSRKLELDEYGTLYYGLVNGTSTLRDIADGLTAKSGGTREKTEEQVIQFTKKLMTMNLILLKIPAGNQVRPAGRED